jgi:hypothetical protein
MASTTANGQAQNGRFDRHRQIATMAIPIAAKSLPYRRE